MMVALRQHLPRPFNSAMEVHCANYFQMVLLRRVFSSSLAQPTFPICPNKKPATSSLTRSKVIEMKEHEREEIKRLAKEPLPDVEKLLSVNGGDKLCQMAARKCTDLVKRKGAMKPRLISRFHADLCFGGEVSFVLCFGVLALPLGRSPLCLLAGGEAVAFAIHLQDMDMMSEPVE